MSALARYHECEGLESDTNYEFAVSAVNGAGESGNGTESGSTACSPSPPTVEQDEANVVTISLSGTCPLRYVCPGGSVMMA